MNRKAILTFLFFLPIRAFGQAAAQPQTAHCTFSDGKKITVTYSPEERTSYRLSTDEPLITARGITVPAGEYTVIHGWERYGHFLVLQKATATGASPQLPRIPMSASTVSVSQKKGAMSFVSTGGSCTMQLASEQSNTLLTLEFTEKNTDLPVIP
jgi:hypothetical protein